MLHEFETRLARGTPRRRRYDMKMSDSNVPCQGNPLLSGLPPVYAASARVLVLGSMPGLQSLNAQAYYAHPRNAFWPIMETLVGIPAKLAYLERLAGVRENRVALWDVIGKCRRPGSLDQKVEPDSVVPNDFAGLFAVCPCIELVAFNGALAEKSFKRRVLPDLPKCFASIARVRLPSTSPAYAAMQFEQKRDAWLNALNPVLSHGR